MTLQRVAVFVSSLGLIASIVWILTVGYYPRPWVRYSRQLVFHVDGKRSASVDSPFKQEAIQRQIYDCLASSMQTNPPTLDSPGIRLDTWIWICENGDQKTGQHTGSLFLRRIGPNIFQFWECHELKFRSPDWFPVQGHSPDSLQACVDYYWKNRLSNLIRDFALDGYVSRPDHPDTGTQFGVPLGSEVGAVL